jgi:SLOG cluster2
MVNQAAKRRVRMSSRTRRKAYRVSRKGSQKYQRFRIARQALAAGATLVYGGALNVNTPETRNLTVALHEMIGAYNRASRNAEFAPLINYTPWPWHQDVEAPWLAERRETLKVIPCDAPAGIAAAYGAGDGPGHVGRGGVT